MECRKPVFQLTVFLKLRSRKTVRFLEQVMSADKYPCIFSHKIEAIVFIIVQHTWKNFHKQYAVFIFLKIKSLRSHLKPYFFLRQFRPRPRRLLSSDGKSLLNLWFIPHYTEVKEEYSIGDERKA